MKYFLGIDIGGTKCGVVLGNTKGDLGSAKLEIVHKFRFLTDLEKGPNYNINRICESIEEMLIRYKVKMEEVESIGISCGGPLDSRKGIILSPPNLPGWDNIYIVEIIEKRFKVKTRLQNDANACALAEWKFGAGRGFKNLVFLTFGTGMGAGLILDGKLYSGTSDMAGEIGHIRMEQSGPIGYGKVGSFEGFCSGGGIAQLAKMKVMERLLAGEKVSFCDGIHKIEEINAKIVSDAAKNGDELAKEIYEISGYYLGCGISILIDILNPEVIIVGSIFVRSRELLWDKALQVIEKESLERSKGVCKVVSAELGENIGDYAALAVACNEY